MPPLWWIIAVVILVSIFFIYFTTKGNERKAFKIMIANPDDSTVLSYIEAFKGSQTLITTLMSTMYGLKHREDQLRQSQGYEIIKNCSSVSESAKEQLRIVFISNGIQIN